MVPFYMVHDVIEGDQRDDGNFIKLSQTRSDAKLLDQVGVLSLNDPDQGMFQGGVVSAQEPFDFTFLCDGIHVDRIEFGHKPLRYTLINNRTGFGRMTAIDTVQRRLLSASLMTGTLSIRV